MPIIFDSERSTFKLDTSGSTYLIKIMQGRLVNLYYGEIIPDTDLEGMHRRITWPASFSPMLEWGVDGSFAPDITNFEMPTFGIGDYRITALTVEDKDGERTTDLVYKSHEIFKGKKKLQGLPATYANAENECETLEITLEDAVSGIRAVLSYTVFENLPAMARSIRYENGGNGELKLLNAASACVHLPVGKYEMIHLYGRYYKEHFMTRHPLGHEITTLSSVRGSSGHNQNPFATFVTEGATEDMGEAYGVALLYSGNFDISTYMDNFDGVRVIAGINSEGFSWSLGAGESFQAPEVVTVYSNEGIGAMSRTYNRLFSKNLVRGPWRDKKRPLLINSWEGTFMAISADVLENYAKRASEIGFEMLVMDDGWFGERNDDWRSLGDWYVNADKFPRGLADLVKKVADLGMKFGIWFEPEMISENSDLYREHPDWCLHSEKHRRSDARHQLMLDMTRSDVRDCIFEQMSKILRDNKIDYVKWDFNRNFSDTYSRGLPPKNQGELAHRYILGTYELMERLLEAFPNLLLETCSGGGGRYDAGILYYSPQVWLSDNTDCIDREYMQWGTSLCYPTSSMGSHVTHNWRTSGPKALKVKGDVALWGTFGFELNPLNMDEEEAKIAKAQVAEFHKFYDVIHNGDLYRLRSPYDTEYCTWEFVSEDKSEALLTVVQNLRGPVHSTEVIRLKGLDPDRHYKVEGYEDRVYSGAALMRAGINISFEIYALADIDSMKFHIVAID